MTQLKGRILVVDDDEFFLSMLEDTLRAHGHQVNAVSDEVRAIASAESNPPDLILLDVVLPRIDGLDVLQILKQNSVTSDIPIFLLTIKHSEEILLRGLRHGAEEVIFKPISTEELLLRCESALQRKRRLDALKEIIRRHLDPSVAYQVIQQPSSSMQLIRTHLAVLFADLRGFTQLAESLSPEQTASLLNHLFEELIRCVLRYGGTLDKFLGDGLMALFGAPISYPDNESRAVCAALDMLESTQQVHPDIQSLSGLPIDMGIGISAGEAVVGPLGSQIRSNYTAIGDTVNVAARLTALARGKEIIISESVRQRLEPHIKLEALPSAKLKGKSQRLEIFRVMPGQRLEVAFRRKT